MLFCILLIPSSSQNTTHLLAQCTMFICLYNVPGEDSQYIKVE